MTVVRLSPAHPDPAVLARAAELLRAGQLVAFPTETVYGLGAHALDPEAVARVYAAKGRPSYNPLIVHVADVSAARALTSSWPRAATSLVQRYWPGPLTLVLPRAPSVPDPVTAGLATVALRVPAHPVALALLQEVRLPLAAPSANRSGELSPTTAAHVAHALGDRVPLILDGGPTAIGIESTVLDLSGPEPVLLRPGMLGREELARVIGPIQLPAAAGDAAAPRPSPGMLDRHYAPRARLVLVDTTDDPRAQAELAEARTRGWKTGAIVHGASQAAVDVAISLPAESAGYARGLYDALHQLDEGGVALILAEQPPAGLEWAGVRDRLERAARA